MFYVSFSKSISMDFRKQCVWLRVQTAQLASSELQYNLWYLFAPLVCPHSMSTVLTPHVLSTRVLALDDFATHALYHLAHTCSKFVLSLCNVYSRLRILKA